MRCRAAVRLKTCRSRCVARSLPRPRRQIDWAHWGRRIALAPALGLLAAAMWWGWQALQPSPAANTLAEDPTESLVELHEQLELADWSPSPTPSYFISTGYTR